MQPTFTLKLFVTGETARSKRAVSNLKKICEEQLSSHYEIEVIDVLKNPELAESHRILATPTLIREAPLPMQRILGDLSDKDRVLLGLSIYS